MMLEPEESPQLPPIPAELSPRVDSSQQQSAQLIPPCHLKDHVDWVIEGWKKELPELDVAPIAIVNRLGRLQVYLRSEVATVFERYGLSGPSFAVIATLRRAGKPYQLSQRALMDALQLTAGTVSVRIDRLEREGIVERIADPHDQRGMLVRLTEKGERLFDQVAPLHLANEERLLSALNAQQRTQLADLLRILLLSFDAIAPEDLYHPARWIGASLAPAHIARKIRRSSGLPDVPGLLVLDVAVPSPANKAGLQEGDLIVAINGIEIRSIEDLHKQLLAAHGESLKMEVLRGQERRDVYLLV